jgi:hypothetical protein
MVRHLVLLSAAMALLIGTSKVSPAEEIPNIAVSTPTLVVLDAPDNFSRAAGRLGFTGIEKIVFDALSLVTYRVSVPSNLSVDNAIKRLEGAFPAIIVEPGEMSD